MTAFPYGTAASVEDWLGMSNKSYKNIGERY